MQIQTRDMGSVEVALDRVLDFVRPVLGFEEFRRFALLPAPGAAPFHWLQSLEEPRLAFPVVSGEELRLTYRPWEDLLRALRAPSAGRLRYWIIVALPAAGGQVRANLRAPVVVHPALRIAAQTVMREEYPVSYALDACRDRETCLVP